LKPARRHYKLNDDVIKKVRFLAEYGAPLEHIAPAAGVSFPALRMWLDNAKGPDPTREEVALLAAINEGRSKGGMRLISKVAEQADEGDFKAATWMLTHSPAFRDHYSDNAAVNRARQEGIEAASASRCRIWPSARSRADCGIADCRKDWPQCRP
jgi:hypothetical protein